MKRLVFITAAIFLLGSSVFAQSDDKQATSGSVYSKIGVGYPTAIGNTTAQSMGLIGVSYNDRFVGSVTNPAHWGSTVYALGTGGIDIDSYNASNANSSTTNTNFSVNQFQLQLPIIRDKFGVSGSFSPVTKANFRTYEENSEVIDASRGEILEYNVENRGSGGANRAELGFGWKINSNISVGYAASVIFLSTDDEFVARFPESPYRDANFTVETSGVGYGHRVGTFIELPNVLKDDDQLGIGASVSLPVEMDSEQKQTGAVSSGSVNLTRELENSDGPIKLPLEINGGASYRPSELLMVGLEGKYEGWSDYENDFKPSEGQMFDDRYKIGLGMQYFPYVTGSDKFLSSFKYRAGVSYDTGHLRIDEQRVNTLKFALGIGIRSPRSNSSIDLGFEYGIRGTNSASLVQENIWGVSLSLNLAEVMFFRPKLQ